MQVKKLHHFIFCNNCQTKHYFNNFWHTCTSANFPWQAYFIFFIKSKTENQLKFKHYSAPAQRVPTTV